MTNDTPLHQLIRQSSEKINRIFAQCGEITAPIYHIVMESGEHRIIGMPISDPDERVDIMRAYFINHPTRRYVFIGEAWTAVIKIPPGTQPPTEYIRPSQHPDKVEIIAFLGEDRDLGMLSAKRNIIRPSIGRPYLDKLEFHDYPQAAMEGRMVGLLPRDNPADSLN